jgi:NADH-ubiquinone oxidoreductase chain 1
MTEHSASVFVFFFLGEYSSLLLMSALMTIFFLGGYINWDLLDTTIFSLDLYKPDEIGTLYEASPLIHENILYNYNNKDYNVIENTDLYNILYTLVLIINKFESAFTFGFKVIIVVFSFIWIRASFPRLRYDQLMGLCWKALLPLVFAYIIFTFTFLFVFDMFPITNSLSV